MPSKTRYRQELLPHLQNKAKAHAYVGDAKHQSPEGYYQKGDDCHSENHLSLRGTPWISRNSCVRATVGTMAEFPGPVVADLQLGMTAVTNKVDHVDSPFLGSGNPGAVQGGRKNGCPSGQMVTRTFRLVLVQSERGGSETEKTRECRPTGHTVACSPCVTKKAD